MARTSRKAALNTPVTLYQETSYKTAIYVRLSIEDKRDKNSNSIEHQILIAKKYIEETHDLKLCSVFTDNGLTGTNFDRPGFDSLMNEIRKGKINCIVVKDLSRFGRDYVEAGNFLEVIFPSLNVRFISINDNYDSFDPRCQGEGICIALKNMINAFYSKDISVKTRAAYEIKQKKGEYTGACAPYGYVKSPDNKNKLIIDDEAAIVVRNIFRWRLEGMSPAAIAKRLNDDKVPTPRYYSYIKGIYQDKRFNNHHYWNNSTIRFILENNVYVGHIALGKQRVDPNILHLEVRQPKENWIISEDMHEAIISQSDFDAVAKLIESEKQKHWNYGNKPSNAPENIFTGLAYCADCGYVFRRVQYKRKNNEKVYSYVCTHCKKYNYDKSKNKYWKEQDFIDVVYTIIQNQINLCVNVRKVIDRIISSSSVQAELKDINSQIQKLQQRFNNFPAKRVKLYNDFSDGLLTANDYKLINGRYNKENEEIAAMLCQLENEKKKFQPQFVNENKWVSVIEKFQDKNLLTREMLIELVKRIEVDGNKKVTIVYNYRDEYSELDSFIKEKEGHKDE